ncbi:MAG TPA: hypothetical protein GYA10_00265 [Alphaproteobacteria bacterium]|nr:hypothetical protein [Alphaproteobacteria bacterium]
MKPNLIAGAVIALGAFGAFADAESAELKTSLSAQAEDFAINNVTTSLYHEFGHLLIDQYEWPILGREENAADTIMTMLLLDERTPEAAEIAADAVRGYLKASERYGETLPPNQDFYGEHELEVQRGLMMACILVGTDRTTFEPLAHEVDMGDERIEDCAESSRLHQRSWAAMKDTVTATQFSAAAHGRRASPAPSFAIVYDDPGERYAPIAALMRERRLLETVAEKLTARFPLRRPATMRATLCDDDDAYYDEESDEISLCYEYVQFYYDLIADPAHAGEGMI